VLLFGCYASHFIVMGNVGKYPQKSTSTFVFLRSQTTLYNVGFWLYNQNMLVCVAIPVYTRLFCIDSAPKHLAGYTWGIKCQCVRIHYRVCVIWRVVQVLTLPWIDATMSLCQNTIVADVFSIITAYPYLPTNGIFKTEMLHNLGQKRYFPLEQRSVFLQEQYPSKI
jgi:hypothetical protein